MHLTTLVSALAGLTVSLLFLAPACQSEGTSGTGGGAITVTTTGSGGSGNLPDPEPLKIVNWNVHNLVNDRDDCNSTAQEWVETAADWNAHRQVVASVLDDIDADIVMLQEVESQLVLQALNDELANPYPELHATEGNDPRCVAVMLLSRVPIDQVITHEDEEFSVTGTPYPTYTYARDCLEAHLTFNGRRLALFGVHYKAKEDDDPQKRLAEAQHTRALADGYTDANAGAGALILGDFNDLPGSDPCNATAGQAPELYADSATAVTESQRWTMNYLGNNELVDHQYANPVLAALLDQSSVEIWHTTEVETASDHAPLIATYLVQ